MPKSFPLISIVIPTYNRGFCIRYTIDSILNQSFKDFEIIIIDDGSTDDTFSILQQHYNQVRYFYQENLGVSAARNAGIIAAKGKLIALLDSDDTWEHDKLTIQINDLISNPSAIAHIVNTRVYFGYEKRFFTIFELRNLINDFSRKPLRERPLLDVLSSAFFTQALIFKKELIKKIGYFNTNLSIHEDLDFFARLSLEGPFYVNNYIGVNVNRYRHGAKPLSNLYNTNKILSQKNLLHIYKLLKTESRLCDKERKFVNRSLSGIWDAIAEEYRKQGKYKDFIYALIDSYYSDPSFHSFFRNLSTALCLKPVINRCVSKKNKTENFRRSQFDK